MGKVHKQVAAIGLSTAIYAVLCGIFSTEVVLWNPDWKLVTCKRCLRLKPKRRGEG